MPRFPFVVFFIVIIGAACDPSTATDKVDRDGGPMRTFVIDSGVARDASVRDADDTTVPDAAVEDAGSEHDGGPPPDGGTRDGGTHDGGNRDGGAEPPPVRCRAETFAPSSTMNVSRTIVISQPGVYDYNNILHRWTGGGSCNQTENQPYILRIAASDVTVRNFYYENAPDGIHIGTSSDGQGHSSGRNITNIVLENVVGRACEDALTTQYGVQNVTIRDSMFLPNSNTNYRDKLLQLNFGNVTIERTTFYGGGSSLCMMFKGGQNLHVADSCFNDCDRAINGSTINGIVGRIRTTRSDLLSERNEGHHLARANIFWDPWKFFTGEGNIHIVSVQDQILDNARTDMEGGATLTVR